MDKLRDEVAELSQKSDAVTRYKEGIVYRDRKTKTDPIYIVKQVTTGVDNSVWIFAYGIAMTEYKKSKGQTIRKMYHKETHAYEFGDTPLGKVANDKYQNRTETVFKEDTHLFMSMVVDGKSTLTGINGPGFFERYPMKYHNQNKAGNNTGVFISLEDVDWEEEDHIDIKSVVKEYNRAKEGSGLYL